jgi:glycerophosphoryl diester phosphodiesterase
LKTKLKYLILWIIELFRFCPSIKNNIDREQLFLVCGHRGSPVNEPENTIPSFERALREGVNSLEIDLCVTKDKEIILWHDWNPDELVSLIREKGFEPEVSYKPDFPPLFSDLRKKVNELNLDVFRTYYNYVKKGESEPVNAHIPTFEEFIKWVADKDKIKYVYLDIKVPDNEKELFLVILDQLDELKKKYNPSCNFIVETFSKEVLETVKLAALHDNTVALVLRPRKITIGNWMTYRRVIRFDVRKKRQHNKKSSLRKIDFLFGCTINNKREMECLIKKGINGMQTDYPRRLTNLAKQYELKRS